MADEKKTKKNKKINRLTSADIYAKISEMESSKLIHSSYYKHLNERKHQLEAAK